MARLSNTQKMLALACVALLFSSGCALFKKPCDCPKWDSIPVPEREYDVHGERPATPPPSTLPYV